MKKAIRCYVCREIVRESDTYKMKIIDDKKIGDVVIEANVEYIKKVCPKCTYKAGYKVSSKKLRNENNASVTGKSDSTK